MLSRVRARPLAPALALALLVPAGARAQAPDRWVAAASTLLGRLTRGQFDSAAAHVDPAVPEALFSADSLRSYWTRYQRDWGAFSGARLDTSFAIRGYHVVQLNADFAVRPRMLRVVFDSAERLTGLFHAGPRAHLPAYADRRAFVERQLQIGSAPWLLGATLTLPRGAVRVPIVVLLHGSGPNDRDESRGYDHMFADLAWGLASRGIAVLRYDKRTLLYAGRVSPSISLEDEVLADAVAALALARAQPEVDPARVFLLGHSLGGYVAPVLAQREDRLAGAALLAANARPNEELLAWQIEHTIAVTPALTDAERAQVTTARALLEPLRQGRLPDSLVVQGVRLGRLKALDALHPVSVAGRIRTPLLILQGDADEQVPAADLGLWRRALAGRPATTLRAFPGLDHLFMPGTGFAHDRGRDGAPWYVPIQRHVDPAVVDAIACWIANPVA